MNKFTNPLDNVRIASPCSQDWNQMLGTDRKRFCGDCKLNVYNLSGMTRKEAEQLLAGSDGRVCVRFYRRADGSILTQDCPVGWAAVKRRVSKMATACASLFFGIFTSLGFVTLFSQPKNATIGELEAYPAATPTPKPKSTPIPLMGAIAPMPRNTPTPKPTPKKAQNFEMGEMSEPLMGKPSVSRN